MTRKVYFIPIIFFISVTILGVACTQKGLPAITSRTTDLPKKVDSPLVITPDLAAGKIIFVNRCGKCHDLPLPEQYTAKRWEGILSYMIPRARLNAQEGVHISAYLKENAAK